MQASVQRFKTQQSLNITVYNARYIGNPNLQPEKSLGGDVGFLFETHDNRHSLDVTYFARNVKMRLAAKWSTLPPMQAVR